MSKNDPFFRILCVDDDPAMLQRLKKGFAVYGFEVVTASHGLDALRQFGAQAGRFGTVLLDNSMPKISGVELVKLVRALDFKGRILVMSGRLSASECRAYQDYEVSGFLHKPFEISMVATMLLQAD